MDPEYLRSDQNESEEIIRTERYGEGVAVITEEQYGSHSKRLRYHLTPHGDLWLICSMEYACWLCNKSGVKPLSACKACGGSAWISYGKKKNEAGGAEGIDKARN